MDHDGRSPRARIVAVALALGALATCGSAHARDRTGQPSAASVAAIENAVQRIRDLRLTRPVAIVQMTPEQAAATLSQAREGAIDDATLAAESRAGAMLGLFARGTDLEAASIRMYRSQLLAFYDFHTRQMVLVEGARLRPVADAIAEAERPTPAVAGRVASPVTDAIGNMIIAHELTHALQDQNFALGAKLDSLRGDADRQLALRSVAEGDAMLVGWASATGRLDPHLPPDTDAARDDATRALMARADGDGVAAAYDYFNFPYVHGLRFISAAYRRGGWPAVNALYADPPQSTQQIIDPALYFDRPTLPDRVEPRGFTRVLPRWTVAARDTYGEIGIQVILERNLGVDAPSVADARDWAGDRMVMLRRRDDFAVIWIVAFRSAGAARRFAAAYTDVLARIDGAAIPYSVATRGRAVMVIVGAPARDGALARSLWDASSITPALVERGRP